jgi:hypothetical protein
MNDDQTPINARPRRRRDEALEDLALALREHLLWPVEDRFLGLGDRGRVAVAGAAAALALAIGVAGFSALGSGGSQASHAAPIAALPERPAHTLPAPKSKPQEPTLHGAAPVFEPIRKAGTSVAGSKAIASGASATAAPATADNTGNAATDTISSSPAAKGAGASASSSTATNDGPPAGHAAVVVAHKFANAFVLYEIGGDATTIRKDFAETATPELTRALMQRPPRQPAGIEVPKARVLNVVPAPSHGTVYPLSVSLLRVGATSELRLEMEQLKNKEWRVTNVLG